MIIRNNSVKPINFEGLKIYDYTNNLNTKSSFAVIEVLPGREHVKSWSKRSDKYYYVLKGQLQFTLEDDEVELLKGDFCIVSKGQQFSYRNNTQRSTIIILIHTPSFDIDSEVFI